MRLKKDIEAEILASDKISKIFKDGLLHKTERRHAQQIISATLLWVLNKKGWEYESIAKHIDGALS